MTFPFDQVLPGIRTALQPQGNIAKPNAAGTAFRGIIEFGTIVDLVPGTNSYRIQIGQSLNLIGVPMQLGDSASVLTGSASMAVYQCGTPVLVLLQEGFARNCWILGAMPSPVHDPNLGVVSEIMTASRVGMTEQAAQHMLNQGQNDGDGTGVEHWGSGTAADSLPGDWGHMNELGVGVMLGKFMTFLRASPTCGIWAFHLDNLLRIHGRNFELFTIANEHRVYDDESEVHDVKCSVKFPWEALGLRKRGNAFETHTAGWKPNERNAYYEPKYPDQTGAWRRMQLGGYLGDIDQDIVMIADSSFGNDPARFSEMDTPKYAGLSEIIRTSDGRIGMRAAKEIILTKYALIPVPQQRTLPDDNKDGDWRKNYKASGEVGEGDEPPEQTDFDWGDQEGKADSRTALFLDYQAWMFNWYRYQNLVAHKKDWKVTEESNTMTYWDVSRALIDPNKLKALDTKFWADMPKYFDFENFDSRIKKVRYYESMSGVAMLDDGSIVIEDGWGSSITMHRGQIQFSCAGDILLRPGRSVVAMAPKDVVLRAGGSVDVTATTRDIRLKADCNLHLLAGNDDPKSKGTGGILLESRAKSMDMNFTDDGEKVVSAGVVVKCRDSAFAVWGNSIYMGTKKMGTNPAGDIMIDCDSGKQNIVVRATAHIADVRNSGQVIHKFSDTKINMFKQTGSIMDTESLVVRGKLAAVGSTGELVTSGGCMIGGGLAVNGSGNYTGGIIVGSGSPFVGKDGDARFAKDVATTIDKEVAQAEKGIAEIPTQLEKSFETGNGQVAADKTAKDTKFSLRTARDYKANDFQLYAARWQQLLVKIGSPKKWEERAVQGAGATYPFPGAQAFTGATAFYPEVKFKMFDLDTGHAKDRGQDGGPYKENKPESQGAAKSLNEYIATVAVDNS